MSNDYNITWGGGGVFRDPQKWFPDLCMTLNKKIKIVKDFRAIIKALQMEGLEDLENPAGYQGLEDLEFIYVKYIRGPGGHKDHKGQKVPEDHADHKD